MRRTSAFLLVFFLSATLGWGAAEETQKKSKHGDLDEIGRRDINKGSWNFWSPERELELGMQLAAEAERSAALLRDPVVTGYIAELSERIARNSDARYPVQIRVVDSNEINAFALPGGFFFINTGMILAAETEAELAAIIAHEVAHVAARHGTKQMTKARIWNLASLPLYFFGGPVAYAIQQGASLAVPLTFLKFSRNAEREADYLGLQYHYQSGYDPAAFVNVFERLKLAEKDEKGGIAKVFSSHPMTKDRVKAAERTIERVLPPKDEYVVNTSRHDQVREYLRRLLGERRHSDQELPVLRIRTAPEEDARAGNSPR